MTRPRTLSKVYDTTTVDLLCACVGMFTLGFVIGAFLWSVNV